jgi:hypothetical protein
VEGMGWQEDPIFEEQSAIVKMLAGDHKSVSLF